MTKTICILGSILTALALFSPCQAQEWAWTYGGSDHDYARGMSQTADGGSIQVLDTYSFSPSGLWDTWVVKLDSNGEVDWQKIYKRYVYETPTSVQQTTDGGYVVAGYTFRWAGDHNCDAWVLKLTANGSVDWQRKYGGSEWDWAECIQQTSDGGFIVAGYSDSSSPDNDDAWVLKLDSDGNVQWQNTYGGPEWDGAESIQQTTEGGYIVAVRTSSFGAGGSDIWILKLDSGGGIDWQNTYGGNNAEFVGSIQQTTDGGYIVAGHTSSSGAGETDVWVLKLYADGQPNPDDFGAVAWQKTYGGSRTDSADAICQSADGGYIVAGTTSSFGLYLSLYLL